MDWQTALAQLRARLPRQREAWGVRGSLRWLEQAMHARGANPSAVRNLIYRDIGTPQDRVALHAVLCALAGEVGLTLPPLARPVAAPLPPELELLGRSKRRAYKQFMASVRAGRDVRLTVSGPAGVGKTLLIEHLERELQQVDPPPQVRRLQLGASLEHGLALAPLDPALPYAVQAARQAAAAQAVLDELRADLPAVLLIRVTPGAAVSGVPARLPDGTGVSAGRWAAETLLRAAPPGVSVLLAVESASDLPDDLPGERIRLSLPTPSEARRYLMDRLGLPAGRADELVRQTGRHLDRLTLLAAARGAAGQGGPAASRLLADPAARQLLAALCASLPPDEPSAPASVLEAALGQPLSQLPVHLSALIDDVNPQTLRPVSAELLAEAREHLPAAELQAALTRLVDGTRGHPEHAIHHLRALATLDRWPEVVTWLDQHPERLDQAARLWPVARERAGGEAREGLARSVMTHHAMLGDYSHPQARDALFTLLDSPRASVRAWARVKLAESSMDAANVQAAQAQLQHPELRGPLDRPVQGDPWLQGAQADARLVEAALARWQGDLDLATRLAADPAVLHGGPYGTPARAALWRGLIAKDAGRWPEAMALLVGVPDDHPLLSARARYQEGDLRLRLGQPQAALNALEDAAGRLAVAGGTPDERARVEARIATALRRLGHPHPALQRSLQARALAQDVDSVLQARLSSEAIPVLLALFRPDEALQLAAGALALLERPGARRAEAEYRLRRTRYRAALAYLTRGLGLPYLPPFAGAVTDHPDLRQARRLLDRLLAEDGGGLDREQLLTFDILLSRALAEPDPLRALTFSTQALAMTDHPYAEAQARAARAEVRLRQGDADAALADINRGHALLRRVASGLGDTQLPDPGLQALLLALEARTALLHAPDLPTLRWLEQALSPAELAPFRSQVWRDVGRQLELLDPEAVVRTLRQLWPTWTAPTLRLPDALAWQQDHQDNGVPAADYTTTLV
ncbi:hypothetical protein [Deinococcus sonorensis]|uniref:Orc1-like AAA ATPase domain-containing protein n=2 Tax=Deinococcus sonorensis TaxID=309891 RepID=A0AAU7U997_9DEIO